MPIKYPQFIWMEKENEALKSEVDSMKNELEEVRGLKKNLLALLIRLVRGDYIVMVFGLR